MLMTKQKLSVIHIAKQRLGISDEGYRDILQKIGGVGSSKELDEHGFEAIMLRFQQLGFKSTWNQKNYGYRPGMASPRQVALVRTLWKQFTNGEGGEKSLSKWLSHKFSINSVRFLDANTAHRVVGALKRMTNKKAA